ncbi:hypothetical protein DQ04_00081280 [Trypanosoma grayi]|uniref:hypothetical protein n=1 Tax=Trypanosoma grayi TaxID=71804 RepID=UPI0004F46468|nr:hypothetical protein DQ04_00081280 [Trypanosoma grayi]KEG15429.1 hypothetical protein DQ04_00081280 [Trypanosoma grayi]
MERVPNKLREVIELLKAQDLRLQNGAFDLSVCRGNEKQQRKLQSDNDVVAFFAAPTQERVTFVVILAERAGGLASSMLADDGLVHLRIYHPNGGAATEKRFIPPRRGVREALATAVRDAVQQPPPPSVPLRLYAVGAGMYELLPVEDEDGANKLLRRCQLTRAVCRVTYRFPESPVTKQDAPPDESKHVVVNNTTKDAGKRVDVNSVQLGAAKCVVEGNAQPEATDHHDVSSIKLNAANCVKASNAQPESPKPTEKESTQLETAKAADEVNAQPVPSTSVERNVQPELTKPVDQGAIIPKLTEPSNESNPQSEPTKQVVQDSAQTPSTKHVDESSAPTKLPRTDGEDIVSREVGKCIDYDSSPSETTLCVLQESPLFVSASEDAPFLTSLAAESRRTSEDSTLAPLRASLEEPPRQKQLFATEEHPAVIVPESDGFSADGETVLDVEVECALGQSDIVVFPFSWRRDSTEILNSLHGTCMIALGVTADDDVHLYTRDGVPLRNEQQTRDLLSAALRAKKTRVGVVAWTGHPCTTGLPLQCHVSWGTQETVATCAVKPENALDDLRCAIVAEYDVACRAEDDLRFFLCDPDTGAQEELTREGAYSRIKEAVQHEAVLQIVVSNACRTPLRGFAERTLKNVSASFTAEVALLLGDRFHARDVVPFFEQCHEEIEISDEGAKDFLEVITLMLAESRVLSIQDLTSLISETASSCSEKGALDVLSRCVAIARLLAARRPFEVLQRFFRRLYRSIRQPTGAHSIPISMVTRQLAQAGLRDAKGMLRRDRTVLSELHEKEYTELLMRLFNSDANMVCRAVVAARLSGISTIRSRRVITKAEQELLRADYQYELRHAFDGIRSADVAKFLQAHGLHAEPRFRCLLGVVGALLATHPVQHSHHWLVERFKGKVADALDVKLRTFEDSVVPTPLLHRLCWDVLRPELHYLSLLSESQVASALACWAFFAVQLVCVNRQLDYPPVPLVDLHDFSPVDAEGVSVVHAGASVTASATAAAALPACHKKKPKIKYKYSYLCRDLRRDSRLPRPVK